MTYSLPRTSYYKHPPRVTSAVYRTTAGMSMMHPPIGLGTVPEREPQSRRTRDRLAEGSWHIDAILPPNAGEMVYEDLQPVAASIQGTVHPRS